ncbi:hypothetical protein [Geomonas azotofigens]|uniref:hypothetical protein n=1 Tax=Geomonas azotofigens TaxID=2843196 RepID=UPI001C104BAA|nr:hypothetical protein [Geomonas azotofigens]MBU5615315.1 hypothetical protein [Geomonas azotofigens]
MRLSLYLEHGEQFSRAALKLPVQTPIDIESTLLNCYIEVLPVAASHYMGPEHLPGIEFPHPDIRVVFQLKEHPQVAAVYSIDVFVTDAMLSLVSHAQGHTHVDINRRAAHIERLIANKQNGLLELIGCNQNTLVDRLTQAFLGLRSAYLNALNEEGCLPIPKHY